MSSWQLIGLAIASRFDRGYAWAKKPVKISNLETEKYDSSYYLGDRPQLSGADYFMQRLEEKRLMEQARQNLQTIRPGTPPNPYFVPSGSIPDPYANVSLAEKIRIQNILSSGL